MNAREAVFAFALAAALLVVATGATKAQLFQASAEHDRKNLGDLVQNIEQSLIDVKSRDKLKTMKEVSGRAFWSDCIKYGLLEREMIRKLVSIGSTAGDQGADSAVFEDQDGGLTQGNCSYTSPKAEMLRTVMNLKGSKRTVLYSFDSRNWNNYGKKGVLVAWSEGDADYLTQSELVEVWKHPAENWKDPAAKIIGQLKPFNYTFQEAECAAYVNPDAPKKDDTDYNSVYRKKGRSWTFSGTEKRGHKEVKRCVRYTVREVKGDEATLVVEQLNDEGNVKPDGSEEETLDLTDPSLGKPTRCKLSDDAETEIEAAGKKWKVRKWVQFDGKRTYWMSTEIPGLLIKAETGDGQTLALTAFKDGQ